MVEDFTDYIALHDRSDDFHLAAAFMTMRHILFKDPGQELCPGLIPLGPGFLVLVRQRFFYDLVPDLRVRSPCTMISDLMLPWLWHNGGQFL